MINISLKKKTVVQWLHCNNREKYPINNEENIENHTYVYLRLRRLKATKD